LDRDRSNQVWALDTTYIPIACGFTYLTAAVDVARGRVFAQKANIALEAFDLQEARGGIEQAFASYGPPEIVNPNFGNQFTAAEFNDVVLKK